MIFGNITFAMLDAAAAAARPSSDLRGEISTTNRNSVNCFSVYCVLSPFRMRNWSRSN